jgi:uncharacterized membrane protein YdcZ (DUF606 family)
MVIAGNLVMAALIDRFGLLGNEQIDLNWSRVLGLLLLVAGATVSDTTPAPSLAPLRSSV